MLRTFRALSVQDDPQLATWISPISTSGLGFSVGNYTADTLTGAVRPHSAVRAHSAGRYLPIGPTAYGHKKPYTVFVDAFDASFMYQRSALTRVLRRKSRGVVSQKQAL